MIYKFEFVLVSKLGFYMTIKSKKRNPPPPYGSKQKLAKTFFWQLFKKLFFFQFEFLIITHKEAKSRYPRCLQWNNKLLKARPEHLLGTFPGISGNPGKQRNYKKISHQFNWFASNFEAKIYFKIFLKLYGIKFQRFIFYCLLFFCFIKFNFFLDL